MPRNRAFPDHVSSPHATHLICLVPSRLALVSFALPPSVPHRQRIFALPQMNPLRLLESSVDSQYASPCSAKPHSARVAHSLPLTGLILGSHRWIGGLTLYLDGPSYVFPISLHPRRSLSIPISLLSSSPSRSTSYSSRPFFHFFLAFGHRDAARPAVPYLG